MALTRKRRVYSQDVAWRWLRRHPGSQSPALAEAMRLTPNAAAHVLGRLKRAGYARMDHLDHRKAPRFAIWFAVGDAVPSNRSGCSIASLLNLRMQWDRWEENLRLARFARGQDECPAPRRPRAPASDAHPLAVAWKMPISCIDDAG